MRYWLVVGVLVLLNVACGEGPPPKACLNNGDCLLKGQVCRENTCVQQATCSKDDDCKYKSETCVKEKCTIAGNNNPIKKECRDTCFFNEHCNGCSGGKNFCLEGNKCGKSKFGAECPRSCTIDANCQKCKECRTSCVQGFCVISKRADDYARCDDFMGVACKDKSLCWGGSGKKYCIPKCDMKAKTCFGGKNICYPQAALQAGLCVPEGTAGEGKSCDKNFSGEKKLDAGKLCKPGYFCGDKKSCKKIVTVKAYQKCEPGRECDKSAKCVFMDPKLSHGYCLPVCDLKKTSCNDDKGVCIKLDSGTGACIPKGTGQKDTACGAQGDELKASHFCSSGLQCMILTTKPLCLPKVAQCDEKICGDGRICLPGTSLNVCAADCSAGKKCPNGLQCSPLKYKGQDLNVCTPQ